MTADRDEQVTELRDDLQAMVAAWEVPDPSSSAPHRSQHGRVRGRSRWLRSWWVPVVAAVALVAALIGVSLFPAQRQAPEPAAPGTTPTDPSTATSSTSVTSTWNGASIELPGGWAVATETLTPNLAGPVEVFTASTAAMPVGGDRCAQAPEAAMAQLGPTDALVTVQRGHPIEPGDPVLGQLEGWPEAARNRTTLRACPENGDLLDMYWFRSRLNGTGYWVLGVFGADTTDLRRAQALAIVNSLQPSVGPDDAIELDCSTVIESEAELPEDYADILGVVGLPTAESSDRALQAGHHEENALPYFAKTGLLVRADTGFTITVDEPNHTARILWGNSAREFFGSALTTSGCPGNGWLAFPGGVRVDEPRCVSLTVTTPGAAEAIQIGAGAPCPGQEPPPGEVAVPTGASRRTCDGRIQDFEEFPSGEGEATRNPPSYCGYSVPSSHGANGHGRLGGADTTSPAG